MTVSEVYRRGLLALACALIVAAAMAAPKPAQAQEGAQIGGSVDLGVGALLTQGNAVGVTGGALVGGLIGNEIQKDKRHANYNRNHRR